MKTLCIMIVAVWSLWVAGPAYAEKITVAAAADLKFAMDEILVGFKKSQPGSEVEVVYGSSGKFHTQIQQGAPYDLFFSADIAYPRELAKRNLAASDVMPYAVGRIVLWSNSMDVSKMSVAHLNDPKIIRIAMANPRHAPYGKRAEEALKAAGVWNTVQGKLVFGENIAHSAQFVQTGNAQVGILALSLAVSPELARKGSYSLIPATMHQPLEQGFMITRPGGNKPLARKFADYMGTKQVRAIMSKYGFVLPDGKTGK